MSSTSAPSTSTTNQKVVYLDGLVRISSQSLKNLKSLKNNAFALLNDSTFRYLRFSKFRTYRLYSFSISSQTIYIVDFYHISMYEHNDSQYISITHFLRLVIAFINDVFFQILRSAIFWNDGPIRSLSITLSLNTNNQITGGNENSEARS